MYLTDYFKKIPDRINEDVIHIRGLFSIKYKTINTLPQNTFGMECWKDIKLPMIVSFYENDNLLFEKELKGSSSGIIIHGDGINKDNTFFSFCEDYTLNIYNMNNKIIGPIDIGGDYFSEFKRVNEKYAIGDGQEGCTCCSFTGLFNLDILFGIEKSDKQRAYNNSRVHFPISKFEDKLSMSPIIAKDNGFEVNIINGKKYSWVNNNIVSYDDVFNGIADFYEEDIDIEEEDELK